LNVRGVNDVRQTEIHTAELLMFEPNAFEVELDIEKLKSHKSPGTDQIPAELIKTGGRAIRSYINKIVIYVWNKEELTEECKELIIVPIYVKSDKTDCNNYRGISLLQTMYKILSNILLSKLTPYAEKLLGIITVDFDATDQLLTICSVVVKYMRKKLKYNRPVHQHFIDFKKACDSVRREVFYKILIEFSIHMKLVRLIKMYLNET